MDESTYHRLADKILQQIADHLEASDAEAELDIELAEGVLTIELVEGRHYVINKHAASRQIWVSSPLSGGLHFSWDEGREQWLLPDSRELQQLAYQEIADLSGIALKT